MAPTSDPSLNLTIAYSSIPMHKVILDYGDASNETCWALKNREISVHYAVLDEVWNRNEMIVIMFSDNIEPRFIDERRHRTNWLNWKQAIQVELDSLSKRKVFGFIVSTSLCVKLVCYM
ncbi:hypothetical protein ACFX14_034237 [Malus domestica]